MLAGAWAAVSRRPLARRTLLAISLLYLLASVYAVPHALWRVLVAGYQPLSRDAVPPGRVAVVLLGSGSHLARDWSGAPFAVADRIGASRLAEAARVFRMLDAEYLVSAGGLIEENAWVQPSGEVMASHLEHLGIPRDRIVVESESQTTQGNAEMVKPLLAARPVEHVVLVTSQIHMRRAAGAFRALGIPVIPAVARDTPLTGPWWSTLVPSDKGLEESAMVAHETLGFAMYAARGWYRP